MHPSSFSISVNNKGIQTKFSRWRTFLLLVAASVFCSFLHVSFVSVGQFGVSEPLIAAKERPRSHRLHPATPLNSSPHLGRATIPNVPYPPPLARLLPSPRPARLIKRRDWRRPAILTAHVSRNTASNIFNLTIFTAGILLHQHNRTFHVVGCMIGDQTYPADFAHFGKVACTLPFSATPTAGDLISVVLALDRRLREALSGPVQTDIFTFKVHSGDVYAVPSSVNVHISVKRASASKSGGKLYKLMAVVSSTTWQPFLIDDVPSPATPRHELCMMTSMKQYPYLLPSWIRYYRRMGVDKFYIYDNDAASDLSVFKSPFVEVVYWPHVRSQPQLFTHFLHASKARCKFAAFFDADEYVLVGDNGPAPLKRYVQRKVDKGFMQIAFIFIPMANNGYVHIPKGELPELYTKRDLSPLVARGKSIIDTDAGWSHHTVHQANRKPMVRYFNTTLELLPKSLDHSSMLVHFTRRSWEEYVLKQTVGSASPGTKRVSSDNLHIEVPKDWYMKNKGVREWHGMRDYFRNVMEHRDDGRSYITWMKGSEVCRQRWCGSCRDGPQAEEVECRKSSSSGS